MPVDRATTCCFTGHRPDKLPWGSRETDPRCCALKIQLDRAVRAAWEAWGRPAALAVAGTCLVAYALVIARARGGGGR